MKKNFFDCELVEWPLICRDLYQHMWMGGPDATPDLWKQPFSAVRASGGYPGNVEIWRMNLKNNRAPLQCYFKLCASFRSHWWIQTGITVRKRQIWVKFDEFQSRVTLKFDVWLSCTTSSFLHHFVAIGVFKLELESGNAQFGSNLTIFRAVWPWNLTDDLEKQQDTSLMLL